MNRGAGVFIGTLLVTLGFHAAAEPGHLGARDRHGAVRLPPAATWYWQLTKLNRLDTQRPVQMYDVDLYETPQSAIAALKGAGKTVICYFNAGAHEAWRSDEISKSINAKNRQVVGKAYDGWPGEFWYNTARPEVRRLASRRMDLAVSRGCDGVEPDNTDGYTADTGFSITQAQALEFSRFLVAEAHARHLSVGLKNSVELVPALAEEFDWALVEECFESGECEQYLPFAKAGKAVFVAEYTKRNAHWCDQAARQGFQLVYFPRNLDGGATFCPRPNR